MSYITTQDLPAIEETFNHESIHLEAKFIASLVPITRFINLTHLTLRQCVKLKSITCLEDLGQLTHLHIEDCASISQDIQLGQMKSLTRARIHDMSCRVSARGSTSLKELYVARIPGHPDVEGCSNLEALGIFECPGFTTIAPLLSLPNIVRLYLGDCMNLNLDTVDIWNGIQGIGSIRYVDLRECSSLTSLNDLRHFSLDQLVINRCPVLQDFDALAGCSRLAFLKIWPASHIKSVDALADCGSLKLLEFNLLPDMNDAATAAVESLLDRRPCKRKTYGPSTDFVLEGVSTLRLRF